MFISERSFIKEAFSTGEIFCEMITAWWAFEIHEWNRSYRCLKSECNTFNSHVQTYASLVMHSATFNCAIPEKIHKRLQLLLVRQLINIHSELVSCHCGLWILHVELDRDFNPVALSFKAFVDIIIGILGVLFLRIAHKLATDWTTLDYQQYAIKIDARNDQPIRIWVIFGFTLL